jgi:hypothetical protein
MHETDNNSNNQTITDNNTTTTVHEKTCIIVINSMILLNTLATLDLDTFQVRFVKIHLKKIHFLILDNSW